MRCAINLLVLLLIWCYVANGDSSSTLKFLQNELAAVGTAQQKILGFLAQKNIHIGQMPISSLKSADIDDIKSKVVVSTEENNIECRVALAKAPIGSKCIAPCGCSGSQKWIQFSEFNKLRRNDPAQWIFCPTCQQKFLVSEFTNYGGIKGNLIGVALNNMPLVRLSVFLAALSMSMLLSVHKVLLRFLTSHVFWQAWPSWMTFVRLPLPLKFMGLKWLLEVGFSRYLALEKSTLRSWLIDLETRLIEENLPVEGSEDAKAVDADTSNGTKVEATDISDAVADETSKVYEDASDEDQDDVEESTVEHDEEESDEESSEDEE